MEARILREPHSSFSSNSWEKKKKSLKKSLLGVRKSLVQLQLSSSPQKQFLVHIVKRGETLSSISKQYGVSIPEIAAVNGEIVDIDLLLEGQQLNILANNDKTQTGHVGINTKILDKSRISSSIQRVHGSLKLLTNVSSYHLHAKPTGYFLLLIPFVALCVGCIIKAVQQRVAWKVKIQDIHSLHASGSESNTRWRKILSDQSAPGASAEVSDDFSKEDQPVAPFEDMSRAYEKLEPTYSKFLSDCGMSKWGYWRGGSPD